MFHTRPHSNNGFAIRHAPARKGKFLVWDIAMVVAIALALTFVAMRSNTSVASWITHALVPDRSANVPVPPPAPYNGPTPAQLIAALKSPDSTERAKAAYQLGAMHETDAADALLLATYDPDRSVREQATFALGEMNAIKAMPRLRELTIVQGNTFIKTAAIEAQQKITRRVAAELNVSSLDVQALAVAQNGIAYAVVSDRLYTLNAESQWLYINQLPDALSDIAVGPDGQLVYVATRSAGLYRSVNGGETWEFLEFGLDTPTSLVVTAVAIHPENVRQLYIALAAPGANPDQLDSLGVSTSNDGGKNWVALSHSPSWSVTRHLVIDRTTPGYLYGLADDGPWRYALPSVVPDPN